MRVTGGAARGRRLKSPRPGIRPTSDLVRGAIFDALDAHDADLSRVLDLYAGSGAVGIEALSRGAGSCDFVEADATNVALIKENLRLAGVEERGRVHRAKAERATERLSGPYTLILADPPYNDDAASATLERTAGSPLAGPATTIVLEHSSRRDAPERLGPFVRTWARRYGDSQVSMYRAAPQDA